MRKNIHFQATNKKNKNIRSMTVDVWDFNKVENLTLTYHTVSGGRANIPATNSEQILIFEKAFGNVVGSNEVLRDGTVIELGPGESVSLHGQFKFYRVQKK